MDPLSVVVQAKGSTDEPIYFTFQSEDEKAAFLTCLHANYRVIFPTGRAKTTLAREAIALLYKRERERE